MVTDIEPDIVKCDVKRALGSITTNKASGGDGIPAGLFQILKDSCSERASLIMPGNLENSAVIIGKGQFSFQSQRRAMPKNVQTTIKLC